MAVIPADEQHVPSPPRRTGVEAYGNAVGDAVDGAFAVLAVSGALVRYAAEAAATVSRATARATTSSKPSNLASKN